MGGSELLKGSAAPGGSMFIGADDDPMDDAEPGRPTFILAASSSGVLVVAGRLMH